MGTEGAAAPPPIVRFPIPMRGNELIDWEPQPALPEVSDPHEG